MSELEEAVQHELERLEENAEDIEKSYTEFFTKIGTSTVEDVIGSGYFWDTPSDELEGIRRKVLREYELWYNTARPLISDYMPDRLEGFDKRYEDFVERLRLEKDARKDTRKVLNNHNSDFDAQRGILESIPSKVQVEELRIVLLLLLRVIIGQQPVIHPVRLRIPKSYYRQQNTNLLFFPQQIKATRRTDALITKIHSCSSGENW